MDSLARMRNGWIGDAADMFVRAFVDYPLYNPPGIDPAERRAVLGHYFRFAARYAMKYGEAYATSSSMEGAALWLPPGKTRMTVPRALRAGLIPFALRIGIRHFLGMAGIDSRIGGYQGKLVKEPHW